MDKKYNQNNKKQWQRWVFFLVLTVGLISVAGPSLLAQEESLEAPGAPNYENPLAVDSFTALAVNVLETIQSLVGYLTVIMIVIGGIVYIISAGNQSMTTVAKNIIKYALIGFILVIAFPTLLKEVKDIAGGGNVPAPIEGATSIGPILINVLNFLLTLVGTLATIVLIVSGIMFLISGGNSGRVEKARKMIFYAVISIAVSAGALVLLNQILNFF